MVLNTPRIELDMQPEETKREPYYRKFRSK